MLSMLDAGIQRLVEVAQEYGDEIFLVADVISEHYMEPCTPAQ
jgi:hypothetical protein